MSVDHFGSKVKETTIGFFVPQYPSWSSLRLDLVRVKLNTRRASKLLGKMAVNVLHREGIIWPGSSEFLQIII
uniref:Uncharacterized protein n=1 Tax=Rhizophora mucronata TaxID=61149 RepID=A0A2P2QC03_RHIMU